MSKRAAGERPVCDRCFGWDGLGAARSGDTGDDKAFGKIEKGEKVVVPALWFAEVANSLLLQQRRNRLTADERKLALETLAALNPAVDGEGAISAFRQTSELAQKQGLTVYDATYLELALRLKLPLAARDESLRKAATRCGVEVI